MFTLESALMLAGNGVGAPGFGAMIAVLLVFDTPTVHVDAQWSRDQVNWQSGAGGA